ncbi:hypothetical protein BASA61_009354 [Batrachochytrium salamandrivorans]|nr:hypothetical protein BASA60_011371 [Batrachochytrium salamandrivorans]KAH6575573.1 hypothetical protein BASA62_001843 [Batrachochytrium salamandrivorans]KAH6580899.1 hypothetical protein BASA61_009354 [Batrachochytrium salamandrivorans]KAH9244217.1 hypothetical protein BASA81_018397 [Batrachochytrium salamandrivorans]
MLAMQPDSAETILPSTVPEDCFQFFAELSDILVQVSRPEKETPVDTQGLAIAAKMSALIERIQKAHLTIQQLPSIHQTTSMLERLLVNYAEAQKLEAERHSRLFNSLQVPDQEIQADISKEDTVDPKENSTEDYLMDTEPILG